MTVYEQLKGRFTEEEVKYIYKAWLVSGAIDEESFVELYRGNGWIEKTSLEDIKEKWDSKMKKEWPKDYNTLKNEAYSMVDMAEEIFALYEKEIKRLKGER